MYTFKQLGLTRLNNAEFTAFFINLQKEITQTTAVKLGIPAGIVTQLSNDLDKLQDQVYNTTASSLSAEMIVADAKRDAIYRRILLRLQLVNWGEDVRSLVTARDAVNTYILANYDAQVSNKPYQEETTILAGFIKDVRAKLTEDDIDALGIDNDLSALESANNAFIVKYNSRVQEKAVVESGITKALRVSLQTVFDMVMVNTQFYANSTDEAEATKAADCQTFIGRVNVLIGDAKARLQQRMTILKKSKDQALTPSPSPEAVEGSGNPDVVNPGAEVNPVPEVVGPASERDEAVSE